MEFNPLDLVIKSAHILSFGVRKSGSSIFINNKDI